MTLPRTSGEAVKAPDVWLSVAFGGLVAILAGFIMVKLSMEYPDKRYINIAGISLASGREDFSPCFDLLFLATSGFQVRSVTEVMGFTYWKKRRFGRQRWFLWSGIYLLTGGINPLARLYEIIFPITVLIF
ncbi:GerAB/ArcD/ProY family transporter [Bacillus licheniformis]|nr:GerAB/ArcD/ProY family transporter [Bacillus licheniformis]